MRKNYLFIELKLLLMAEEKLPPKVYTYGVIGRRKDIETAFAKYGVSNPCEYKFGDPGIIYFINKHNEIMTATPDSEIFYIITNSQDWKPIKLKRPKKKRKFLVSINEGSSSCNGCALHSKCNDDLKKKCDFAKILSELMECQSLSGKTLEVEEVLD